MNVAIAGAHGQIALRLARLLAAEGDRVIGLIRTPDHAAEVSRGSSSRPLRPCAGPGLPIAGSGPSVASLSATPGGRRP